MEVENDETSRQVAAALFEEHSPMMLKVAFKVTANRDDAKDVVQTVFTRLMRNWPLRSFMKNPMGFFYRAARNEARSLVRAQQHRERREVCLDSGDSIEIPAPEVDTHPDDRMGRVRAAMAKMKPGFVEILNLFYIEECDCYQIAAMQGKPLGTVLVHLGRARAQLKQLIAIEENLQ
jgi:RNA polymerase sigma factor (sigma-70 family)